MSQLTLFPPHSQTVSEVTRYLRELMESDPTLSDLWVQGEVSNLSRPSSGHMYFTLKDSSASLRCVMWRTQVQRQRYLPSDGAAIEVHGSISIYEAGGAYQLYADILRPLGEGALYQEFLRLKARLEAEGLFDVQRKRSLPRWPQRIGIVTSPTGAALRDMLNVLRRRYPLAEVILAPTAVQGEEAPAGIIRAIQALNQREHPDLILLARGGGSLEDLWAFNDEGVARAIAASAAPVITGVGHETDFTIADFVADLRAPTPTAAAELATPDQAELRQDLLHLFGRLGSAALGGVEARQWALQTLHSRLRMHSPQVRLLSDQQRLDELAHRMGQASQHRLQIEQARLRGTQQHLSALNPMGVLQRGFALVTSMDGSVVHRKDQICPDQSLQVQVSDGRFSVKVTSPDDL
ncbi:MAG: exodeoxyribonuclease VII large subunit [Anaerolineales bacterium]|jgi:exodeoxyribonuclease VII large subunit|nr:exodeoxyribonuclease VII large subunit [Anaerolineales bacterium]